MIMNLSHFLVKIRSKSQIVKRLPNLIKASLILSFAVALITLYFLYPESYERTWKGRIYYIFFLWLSSLKLALNWENIPIKIQKAMSRRFMALTILAFLPASYVLIANFSGLNILIMNLSPKHYGLDWWSIFMPLTIEYLIFTALSLLMAILAYGVRGLRHFLLPITFLGIVGLIFLTDNLYPFGEFTPFQILVPTTATLASNILNLMGYETELKGQIYKTPVLKVWNEKGEASFGIAWPCSGIDSLIIYSIITMLFLEDSDTPLKYKIAYFLIGAVITYFINALRISEIFIIAINYGVTSLEVQRFHDYYGPLYSIVWIIAYQLMIVGMQSIRRKLSKDL